MTLYVIEAFFDPATDAAIRAVWRALGERGIASPGDDPVARPHLTLGVYGALDLNNAAAPLAALAAGPVVPLTFASLGLFPPSAREAIVFAAPIVTAELLALHLRVRERLAGCAADPAPYYAPGRFVPHCTLTQGCPPTRIAEVLGVCRSLPLPLTGQIAAFGLVVTDPLRELWYGPQRAGARANG